VRDWLGRFPLSILQLGMRVGVGMVFFKAGLLKYQSFEFAVKLFQDEYKLPFLPPAIAARISIINELTTSPLLFLGLATRLGTFSIVRNDFGDSDFRLSHGMARSRAVGFDSAFPVDARTRCAFRRLSHRTVFSGRLRPIRPVNRMASPFSAVDHSTRYAHRGGIGIFQFRPPKAPIIRLRNTALQSSIQDSALRSGCCRSCRNDQRADLFDAADAGDRNARGDAAVACHASGASARLPGRLAK